MFMLQIFRRYGVPSALAIGAFAGCHRQGELTPGSGHRGAGPPVPVVAGSVEQRDTPIYLEGIGTVQGVLATPSRSKRR